MQNISYFSQEKAMSKVIRLTASRCLIEAPLRFASTRARAISVSDYFIKISAHRHARNGASTRHAAHARSSSGIFAFFTFSMAEIPLYISFIFGWRRSPPLPYAAFGHTSSFNITLRHFCAIPRRDMLFAGHCFRQLYVCAEDAILSIDTHLILYDTPPI